MNHASNHSSVSARGAKKRLRLARTVLFAVVSAAMVGMGGHAHAKKAFPNGGKRTDGPNVTASPSQTTKPSATKLAPAPKNPSSGGSRSDPRLRRIGFRSQSKLEQHFQKHGREFGDITIEEYLVMAQDLRDAPLSKTVIETTQKDGTISRFNRQTGGFMAFESDLTIRTFFHPNDGERYFWRAASRSH